VLSRSALRAREEKLLDLIKTQKNRFRLLLYGRLAFAPQSQAWQAMVTEVVELLLSIHEMADDSNRRDAQASG
jgi:hypothetical protein